MSIKECFYHYCMNDGLVQHVSVNEQKLASHVMWKNIYIENPDNVYALWDHIWVNYDFIKNIIAADQCWNYFDELRNDIAENIRRIKRCPEFFLKFKLELWLIARCPVLYIRIRKLYALKKRIRSKVR